MSTVVTGPNGEQGMLPTPPPGINGTPESAYANIASKTSTDESGNTKPIIIVGDEDDGDYR